MRKIYVLILTLIFTNLALAYDISNTTVTDCSGVLYDNGGSGGNYTSSQDLTFTISPTGASSVTATFASFNMESGWDFVYVYDGATTGAAQVAGSPFTGTTIPGAITSSGGSLTIRMTSDGSVTRPGFELNWACTLPPVTITNGSTSDCSGTLVDNGGAAGNYTSSQDLTYTIESVDPCVSSIDLNFTAFNMESGWDFVYVYDGNSTGATQVAGSPFTGTTIPGAITSSGKALTIRMTSDGSVTRPGFEANWSCNSSITSYNISNTTVTDCCGELFDNGGSGGNYTSSQDLTFTITPGTGKGVNFNFTSFNMESGWDYVYVYDGATTGAAQVAGSPFTGTTVPGAITSSGESLTIRMTSDGSVTRPGFESNWSCYDLPSCQDPSAMAAANITTSTADLTWTASGSAETDWNIEWGAGADFVPGTGAETGSTSPTATPAYNMTGLTSNTTYFVYYQANCGGIGTSSWVGPFTFTTLPSCGDNVTGLCYSQTSTVETLLNFTVSTPGDWATLTFNAGEVEACCDEVLIYDGLNGTGNILYGALTGGGLADYSGEGTITSTTGILSLVVNSDGSVTCNSNGGYTSFDVTVNCVPPPACQDPSAMAAANITANTADLTWTAGVSAETNWNLEWGAGADFAPGTGAETGSSTPSTTPAYGMTGLTGNTTYYVYYQADCATGGGTGTSTWVGPVTFTTLCASITTFPSCQAFTGLGAIPDCWSTYGSENWIIAGTWPDYGANVADNSGIGVDGSGANGTDATLETVAFDLSAGTWTNPPRLKFDIFSNNTTNPGDNALVTVEITDDAGASWSTLTTYQSDGGWVEVTADLNAYSSDIISLRFVVDFTAMASDQYENDIIIEDVCIEETPSCQSPSAMAAANITYNSADLTWTAGTSAETNWNLEWGAGADFAPGTGAETGSSTPATTSAYNMTGLTSNTTYYVYYQADCASGGGSGTSAWVGPFTFTTGLDYCGSDNFVDAGGGANYSSNANNTWTICPDSPTDLVSVNFTNFEIEGAGADDCWDWLRIYDGNTTGATQITPASLGLAVGTDGFCWEGAGDGTLDLTDKTIYSTDATGCLTFNFTSDGSVTRQGWEAVVTCNPKCGSTTPTASTNLAGATASATCIINDGNWHHYYDGSDDLLMSINANGQDLGSTTVSVTVGDSGPFGEGLPPGVCGAGGASAGEYSMPRYWDITVDNQPTNPVDVIFYYLTADVNSLIATTGAQNQNYKDCWGEVTAESDLMMTVEHTGGALETFTLAPTAGPGAGQRQIQFQMSEFSGGKLHSNGGVHSNNALPVELLSFVAKANEDNIQLDWSTVSEINNEGFEIERSKNGVDFAFIEYVNGNGTTTEIQNYSSIDRDAEFNTTYYYRLKQIDFDGQYEYSNIVAANLNKDGGVIVENIRPNPTNGNAFIDINISAESVDVQIEIFDLIGQTVSTKVNTLNAGNSTLQINDEKLSSGTYIVKVSANSFSETYKLVVVD